MYGFLFPQAELRYLNTDNFISFDGGGGRFNPPPIFICDNKRKSNKFMQCVYFFGMFEGINIFHVFQLSFDRGDLSIADR